MGNCLSTSFLQEHERCQYPRNKVVPEPVAGNEALTSSTEAGKRHAGPQCKGVAHHDGYSKPVALQAGQPDFRQLPQLQRMLRVCTSIHAENWHEHSQQLRAHVDAATAELQAAQASISRAVVSHAVHTCTACMQAVLGPVVHQTEQLISNDSTGRLAWDSATPNQLMSAVAAAAQAAYPAAAALQKSDGASSTLALLGSALQPLAQLLSWLQTIRQAGCYPAKDDDGQMLQHQANTRSQLSYMTSPSIGALDTLVCAMKLVLYKHVALESPASLQSKAHSLQQFPAQLGWTQQQLSACCSAPLRALLLCTHTAAATQQGEQRVKLTVRRTMPFWDALQQLQEQDLLAALQDSCLCSKGCGRDGTTHNRYPPCKIFPSFLEEWKDAQGRTAGTSVEAGEGHGPRKGFFTLAAANAAGQHTQQRGTHQQSGLRGTDERQPLLEFNRAGGVYWYNTQLEQADDIMLAYRFLGWLMGQSLYNHAPLGLALSPVMMLHLLQGGMQYKPSMQDLQQLDPNAAASISKVASLPAAQFASMLELEGLSPGLTREQYMQDAVSSVLLGRVGWQMASMSQGFHSVIDVQLCKEFHVGPAELAAAIGGVIDSASSDDPLDIPRVFRVVMDEELNGKGEGASVGKMLWQVLAGWPRSKQLQFVEFVTGTSRLPLAGSEMLKVECPFIALNQAQHAAMLHSLPQAHTCDNLLELPNYWLALLKARGFHSTWPTLPADQKRALQQECRDILEDRLTTAVTGCVGYGLDERS